MAENSEDFRVLLDTTFDVNRIKSQLNNIKGLTVKVGVDTSGIKQSIQKAIQDATKGMANINVGTNSTGGSGSSGASNTAAQIEKIQKTLNNGTYNARIAELESGFRRVGFSAQDAAKEVKSIRTAYDSLKKAKPDELVAAQEALNQQLLLGQNNLRVAKANATAYIDTFKQVRLTDKIETWLNSNTAATKSARLEMQAYLSELSSGRISPVREKEITARINTLTSEMRSMGKLGGSFIDTFGKGAKKFFEWTISSGAVMKAVYTIRNMYNEVIALDTALVDLRKTTDATSGQLEDFYYTSNDTAKQLGVTTREVVQAAAAWSRLGYSIKDAQKMSENSAIMASVSPGMNIEKATDGLVSAMKAFKIEADDALDGIISKINIIGNTQAVDNSDIIDILTRSSSAMAEANNTLEDTIALGTAATEITRDADSVGTALKTVSMRIRGYDEETEEYSEDLADISGTIADLTKTASSPGGISLFTDETRTEYKSTRQILQDISEIYDELSDKEQAGLLKALAGQRQGQIVAAILNNFDAVTDSLNSMANAEGNAMREMEIIYDSLEYKMNRLKETGTGIAQNLFGREEMKGIIDLLTALASALDVLTDKLGLLGTVGIGAGIFAGFKNFGRRRQMSPPLTKYAENYMCFY